MVAKSVDYWANILYNSGTSTAKGASYESNYLYCVGRLDRYDYYRNYSKGVRMKIVKGDLLEMGKANEFDIIMHGCNCFNAMGGGIAYQIANQFPDAKLADDETVRGDAGKLGTYTIGMGGRLVILNAYTQYTMSRDGEDVFEYIAFERVLNKIALRFGKWRIGLPLIGMGLAGGDAERIMPMIEKFAERVAQQGGSVTLVEWERK